MLREIHRRGSPDVRSSLHLGWIIETDSGKSLFLFTGTVMQKLYKGLLQTLILDILRQAPDLVGQIAQGEQENVANITRFGE